MDHCESRRKIVQGNDISKQKSKQKNIQALTPLFQSTKYSNKDSSIQWKLHNSIIVQLLCSSPVNMDLMSNTAVHC